MAPLKRHWGPTWLALPSSEKTGAAYWNTYYQLFNLTLSLSSITRLALSLMAIASTSRATSLNVIPPSPLFHIFIHPSRCHSIANMLYCTLWPGCQMLKTWQVVKVQNVLLTSCPHLHSLRSWIFHRDFPRPCVTLLWCTLSKHEEKMKTFSFNWSKNKRKYITLQKLKIKYIFMLLGGHLSTKPVASILFQ